MARSSRKGEKAGIVKRHSQVLDRIAADLVTEEFGPQGVPDGVRFSEVEDLAVELGDALARRIIQDGVARQSAEHQSREHTCPTCGKIGRKKESPDSRILLTRSGDVEWTELECHCRPCRRDFFPSEQRIGAGPDGTQSGDAAQGGPRGDQSSLQSRGQ